MCQPGQPDPLAVPHGTPPGAGLNVPGGELGGLYAAPTTAIGNAKHHGRLRASHKAAGGQIPS